MMLSPETKSDGNLGARTRVATEVVRLVAYVCAYLISVGFIARVCTYRISFRCRHLAPCRTITSTGIFDGKRRAVFTQNFLYKIRTYPIFVFLFMTYSHIRCRAFRVPCLVFRVSAVALVFKSCRVLCRIAIPCRRAFRVLAAALFVYVPPAFSAYLLVVRAFAGASSAVAPYRADRASPAITCRRVFRVTCRRAVPVAAPFAVHSPTQQSSSPYCLPILLSCHTRRGATATTFQPRRGRVGKLILLHFNIRLLTIVNPITVLFFIIIIVSPLPLTVKSISCYFNAI